MTKRSALSLQLLPLVLAVGSAYGENYTTGGGDATVGSTWSPDASAIISGGAITPLAGDSLTYNGGLSGGSIIINSGASLIKNDGTGQLRVSNHIELAGVGDGNGAIQTRGTDWMNVSDVKLNDDATWNNTGGGVRWDTHGGAVNQLDLNGKTLTVNGTANFYFINTQIVGGGTINVTGNGNTDFNWEEGGAVLPANVTLNLTNSRSSSWNGAGVHMLGNVNLNNSILENRRNDGGKSYDGTITLINQGTLRVIQEDGTSNNYMVVNGQITGTGKLVRDGRPGENVFINNASNNYSGGTDLQAGNTIIGASNALSTAGPITVRAGANLDLSTFDQTVNGGTIAGSVSGSGTLKTGGSTQITTNLANISSGLEVTGDTTYAPTYSVLTEQGLQEYRRTGGADLNTDDGTAGALYNGVKDGIPAIDSTAKPYGDNNKFVYTGEIINNSGGPLSVSFGENYDDQIRVKVNGTTVVFDTGWNTPTSGNTTLNPGSNTIEISSFDGVGGAGPVDGWASGPGVGIKLGGTSIDRAEYQFVNAAGLSALGALQFGQFTTTTGANSDNKSLTITATGKLTIDTSGVQGDYTKGGVISGAGILEKAGTGTLVMTGISTYTGRTLVSNGTLRLAAGASISTSSDINVAAGATLQSDSALTVVNKLSGNGSVVASSVDVQGTIAPGNSIGTLTIAGNLTLSGSADIELDRGFAPPPQNSDEINVSGTLTYGGTLNLTNIGSSLQYGDTFDLFDATTISGSFGTINWPAGTTAADWVDNLNTLGSITFVPETSSSVLTASGVALLLSRRRRRS